MINLLVTNTATGGAKKYTVTTLAWNEILPQLENTDGMKATLVRVGNQVYNVELTENSQLPPPVAGLGYVISFTQAKMKGANLDFSFDEIDDMGYRELKLTLKDLRENNPELIDIIGNYTHDNVETLRVKLRMCYLELNQKQDAQEFTDVNQRLNAIENRLNFIEVSLALPTQATLDSL